MGKKAKLNDKQMQAIYEGAKADISWRKLAKRLDIPRSTVSDFLSKRTNLEWWRVNYPGELVKMPKVLIYDIENTPEVAYTWGRWKQNVGEDQVIQRPYMLTWAAKWVGQDTIIRDSLHLHPEWDGDVTNDKPIVKSLWKLIDEADIIIAHNNDRHDEPLFNTRCLVHGLKPPAPYKRIDTLKEVKKVFKFPSNALKSLMRHLDLTNKIENEGFTLWSRCMKGDESAMQTMLDYNCGDIISLEELYLKIRPWIRNHPNVSLYGDNTAKACVACGSEDLEMLPDKLAYTAVSVFAVHRCNDCGKINRSRVTKKAVAQRRNILTNAL